jgi:Glycosyltransferase like family 2
MTSTYSTVIVTRNRPAALELSLPLHFLQSRQPERILVIDSSDDPTPNRKVVERLAVNAAVNIEHQVSAPGMTHQRNIGLAQVNTDVVFFPDDDSLVYPEALARMMHIYDCDTLGRIGGVCAVEALTAPAEVLNRPDAVYQKSLADQIRALAAPLRVRLENRYFPDPLKLAARQLQKQLPPREHWLHRENAVWVEWMTGFRMSFRTEVVRRKGFNENLGRYALYEDIDAGLGVLAGGHSLVATRDAQIYHHKAPESRSDGRQMGVINILNRAYVVLRSGAADDKIKASIERYAQFRIAQFAVGAKSRYGQDRLAGARAAYFMLPDLLRSEFDNLDETYLRLRQACLNAEE